MYNPTEEHGALRQMVRQFAEQEVDPQRAEYNEKEQFNRALFARCGELGLLGVTADESCGGSGMDAVAACVVSEELSAADPAFALSYLAHAMLYVNNVNVNASEAQKRRWLPGACDGSKVCAMAMSEPGAGTDVLGMRTAAVDAGDHYVLDGSKMWITRPSAPPSAGPSPSSARCSATSPRATRSSWPRALIFTQLRGTSTSAPRATASTPTASSSSRPPESLVSK